MKKKQKKTITLQCLGDLFTKTWAEQCKDDRQRFALSAEDCLSKANDWSFNWWGGFFLFHLVLLATLIFGWSILEEETSRAILSLAYVVAVIGGSFLHAKRCNNLNPGKTVITIAKAWSSKREILISTGLVEYIVYFSGDYTECSKDALVKEVRGRIKFYIGQCLSDLARKKVEANSYGFEEKAKEFGKQFSELYTTAQHHLGHDMGDFGQYYPDVFDDTDVMITTKVSRT
jgi:hypothetical protein